MCMSVMRLHTLRTLMSSEASGQGGWRLCRRQGTDPQKLCLCRWRPLREIIALLLQKVLGVVAVLFNQTVYQLDYARSYRTYEDA